MYRSLVLIAVAILAVCSAGRPININVDSRLQHSKQVDPSMLQELTQKVIAEKIASVFDAALHSYDCTQIRSPGNSSSFLEHQVNLVAGVPKIDPAVIQEAIIPWWETVGVVTSEHDLPNFDWDEMKRPEKRQEFDVSLDLEVHEKVTIGGFSLNFLHIKLLKDGIELGFHISVKVKAPIVGWESINIFMQPHRVGAGMEEPELKVYGRNILVRLASGKVEGEIEDAIMEQNVDVMLTKCIFGGHSITQLGSALIVGQDSPFQITLSHSKLFMAPANPAELAVQAIKLMFELMTKGEDSEKPINKALEEYGADTIAKLTASEVELEAPTVQDLAQPTRVDSPEWLQSHGAIRIEHNSGIRAVRIEFLEIHLHDADGLGPAQFTITAYLQVLATAPVLGDIAASVFVDHWTISHNTLGDLPPVTIRLSNQGGNSGIKLESAAAITLKEIPSARSTPHIAEPVENIRKQIADMTERLGDATQSIWPILGNLVDNVGLGDIKLQYKSTHVANLIYMEPDLPTFAASLVGTVLATNLETFSQIKANLKHFKSYKD